MRGALIIFIAMVAIGIALYLIDLLYYRRKKGLPPVNFKPEAPDQPQAKGTTSTQGKPASATRHESPAPLIGAAPDSPNGTMAPVSPAAGGSEDASEANASEEPEVCCGMHMVCEKTNLSPISAEIIYYDDEELDRFRGRDPKTYTPEETEEFRDVLMTLLPQDVAGWSRSIQLREIPLPLDVRDELLLIVSELRTL